MGENMMLLYLNFYECSNRIDRKYNLDLNEAGLLNVIAKAHIAKQSIFVGDLIRLRQIASQATLHNTLKKLAVKKLIHSDIDPIDGRRRRILLTAQALRRYKKLEQLISGIAAS